MRIRLRTYGLPPRLLSVWNFIKILRVEPYLFLVAFQYGLKMTANSQLVQDKICTNSYSTTNNYCHDLPSLDEHDNDHGHYKLRILSDSARYGTYVTYTTIIPDLLAALLLGAWIDRYVKARKLLMMLNVLVGIVENLIYITLTSNWNLSVYYNLLVLIPSSIIGGITGARIALMHYMTSTTPPKLMAIRFMIYDACFTLALPIGQALGGYVLVKKPAFNTGEIRNFTMVYIIALIFEFVALFWIIFMINEKVSQKHEMKVEMKIRGIESKLNKDNASKIKLNSQMSSEDEKVHPIKLLFNFKNIKDMVKTVTKKRPNKGRVQIILAIICLSIHLGEMRGLMNINSQFIQRVYKWEPDWSSYMSSISLAMTGIITLTVIPLLSRVLHVPDIRLAMIAYCIVCINNIIKGTWLSPNAYYIAMVIGSFGGTASVGTKSHLSKIVDRNEMGKIMSFVTTLDTFSPMAFTTIFTIIFTNTIDSYPGTIYQLVSGLVLIPLLSMMWIDLYTHRPIIEGQEHKRQNGDENENFQDDDCENRPKRIYEKRNHHGQNKSQHLKGGKETQIIVSHIDSVGHQKPKQLVTRL